MKRNLSDASQLELEDKVVSIKRVTKVVKMCIRDRDEEAAMAGIEQYLSNQ